MYVHQKLEILTCYRQVRHLCYFCFIFLRNKKLLQDPDETNYDVKRSTY